MLLNNRHYVKFLFITQAIMVNKKGEEGLNRPRLFTLSVVVTFTGRSSALPVILRRCKDRELIRNGNGATHKICSFAGKFRRNLNTGAWGPSHHKSHGSPQAREGSPAPTPIFAGKYKNGTHFTTSTIQNNYIFTL